MNFESGTKLAKFQDSLIAKIKADPGAIHYDKDLLHRLSSNAWVKWAAEVAPNNLVIRQWCLEDIIRGIPRNIEKIISMCYTLAPFPGYLWCEGYSYWLYTLAAIDLHLDFFSYGMYDKFVGTLNCIKAIRDEIDLAFVRSSYVGEDGDLYPAPFGDLRNVKLVDQSEKIKVSNIFIGKFIEKAKGNIYNVKPFYRGMNGHTPSKRRTIRIVNGRPEGFKFYTGYDKKYDNKGKEALDLAKRFFFSFFR